VVAKRYDEPIDVTPDPARGGAPLSFNWRGRRYEIDQWLLNWREAGEWWRRAGSNGNGAHANSSNGNGSNGNGSNSNGFKSVREHEFFRILARPSGTFSTGELDADGFMQHAGGVFDIYIDLINKQWRIARIWD
jgi:Family of unknown function (DUF6504)